MHLVTCKYFDNCRSAQDTKKCAECINNVARNYIEDYYKKANDNSIPKNNPRIKYDGPIEQTAGYKCPVCGMFTDPYHLGRNNSCASCGYILNIGE